MMRMPVTTSWRQAATAPDGCDETKHDRRAGEPTMAQTQTHNRFARIGFTERGDGGLDLSWVEKVENGEVDGAIIVTKNLTDKLTRELLRLDEAGYKIGLHLSCTGWGGTWLEPNVPACEGQLDRLARLIEAGFPARRTVLRIDPIIPTDEGLAAVRRVLDAARSTQLKTRTIKVRPRTDDHVISEIRPRANLLWYEVPSADGVSLRQTLRVRFSVFDQYRHIERRLAKIGRQPFYDAGRFQANHDEMLALVRFFDQNLPFLGGNDGSFRVETCAEPKMREVYDEFARTHYASDVARFVVIGRGCLSTADFDALGIDASLAAPSVNGQNRGGCLCLTNKCELLRERRQCPHKCVYCYWRDDAR